MKQPPVNESLLEIIKNTAFLKSVTRPAAVFVAID